jgi:hypothetical protein
VRAAAVRAAAAAAALAAVSSMKSTMCFVEPQLIGWRILISAAIHVPTSHKPHAMIEYRDDNDWG